MTPRTEVGGQAVIEGVMMRSPRSFAVVCRRPSGEIVVRESAWQPLWAHLRFLRWPFFRGAIVLVESLWNGFSALSFAARQQTVAPGAPNPPRSLGARAKPDGGEMSEGATWAMMGVSLVFGLALFVGVPHLLTWALGFDSRSFAFHLVDGVIKVVLLIGYMAAISLLPDIKRVFQYHGAEHKAIATHEADLPLTVESARAQSRFHPRCGTSFLLIVVAVSVVLFAMLLRGEISSVPIIDNVAKILLKLPLMLPVAALAYELLKLSGKMYDRSAPTDDQLEIALLSIRKTLWRERQTTTVAGDDLVVYRTAAEVDF